MRDQDTYRESDEARLREMESNISKLQQKKVVKASSPGVYENLLPSEKGILFLVFIGILLCIAGGVMIAKGYDAPITKGLGFSMIPTILILLVGGGCIIDGLDTREKRR